MNDKSKTKFTPDSRFKILKKEAIIVSVYGIIVFAALIICALIWKDADPTSYQYVLGFPLWFAIMILILIVGIAAGIVLLQRVFSNVSLDARDPEYDYKDGEEHES